LSRRLGRPQSWSGCLWRREDLFVGVETPDCKPLASQYTNYAGEKLFSIIADFY